MADFEIWDADVQLKVGLTLGEKEARALYALGQYGTDRFLTVFYKDIGESCLKPHEAGLRSLFDATRKQLVPLLHSADCARAAFKNEQAKP